MSMEICHLLRSARGSHPLFRETLVTNLMAQRLNVQPFMGTTKQILRCMIHLHQPSYPLGPQFPRGLLRHREVLKATTEVKYGATGALQK